MASGLQLWSRKLEIDGTTKNCLSVTWLFWLLGWSLSSFSKRNCRGYRYAISTPLSIKGTWEPCMRSPMVIRALPQWLVHQRSRCWLYDLCSLVCKENNLSWRECSRQKQFLIFFFKPLCGRDSMQKYGRNTDKILTKISVFSATPKEMGDTYKLIPRECNFNQICLLRSTATVSGSFFVP